MLVRRFNFQMALGAPEVSSPVLFPACIISSPIGTLSNRVFVGGIVVNHNKFYKLSELVKTCSVILNLKYVILFLSKEWFSKQVKMTTGATIHTTEGLKMTVTRRIKPPIVPTLEMPTFEVDTSVGASKGDSLVGKKGEVSSAHCR